MKKSVLLFIITTFTIALSFSQEKLNIDVDKSEIKWIGEYTFYFGGHDGTIKFKEGNFIKTKNKITGGEFVIDMNSITNTDIKTEEANTSLVNHLKDPDFFDVEKFPISKLVISKVEYHDANHMKIYANFTIKGITLPIDFQAEINDEKQQMKAKFKIDRMRWGISYNSKLRDGALSDAIGFEIKLRL